MAVDPGIILQTAPSELQHNNYYEQIALENKAVIRSLSPLDGDFKTETYYRQESVSERGIGRSFEIAADNLTPADIYLLEKWFHNRRLLRVLGNYCADTIFYQCFQRRARATVSDVGAQIGTAPTFSRTGHASATICQLGIDNRLYPVSTNEPRYEPSGWDMKGMLLENSAQNFFTKSNGTGAGDLQWATHAGSPSIAWDTNIAPHYSGASGCVVVVLTSGTAVALTCSVTGHATMTCSVWLKGTGNVNVEVENGVTAATIVSANVTLTGNVWQKVSLENFSTVGVTSLKLVLNYYSVNTRIAIGSALCTGVETTTRHFITTAQADHGMDLLQITNVKDLPLEATFMVCMDMPPYTGTERKWILHNSGNLELYIEPVSTSSATLYFQKASSSYYCSCTLNLVSYPPNVPIIIAAGWDKLQLVLWVNGVQKDLEYQYGQTHTQTGSFYVGSQTNDLAMMAKLYWLRVDKRLRSDAEILEQYNRYYYNERRIWVNRNEGREFRIAKLPNKLRVGPDQYMASIELEQVRHYHQATIEEP